MRYSKVKRKMTARVARTLIPFITLMAFFSICMHLPAQEKKSPAKPAPAVKPHDPLAGKACVDCHKRVASPNVNCLLAKADLCDFCHQIPAEGGLSKLLETPEPLCFECHRKDSFQDRFVHGPYAAGACVTCHDPHGGNIPGMLRIPGPQMCSGCHKEMDARISNARFQHKTTRTDCAQCHAPHTSEYPSMLKTAVPGLCGKCHEDLMRDQQTAASRHSSVTEAPACMNCHDPHAAQRSRLLLADGLDICLQCHDRPVKAGKQEFADMKHLLKANPYLHGPIQNRDCSACHAPHSSPYFRLLTNRYPQDFYAPFFVSNYDLCFRCHDAGLAQEESTTIATEFREGDRNLHFVHVNRTSHGRTCRSCHKVHAGTTPALIAETVPFGNWKLPVKFERTDNGGSCAPGCHALQKYNRRTAKPE